MAKDETWYDQQALMSKLITYAALLILLGSIGWAAYSAWLVHQVGGSMADYHWPMVAVIGGIATSAFLLGIAAIIDLLIVQCEALRNRR